MNPDLVDNLHETLVLMRDARRAALRKLLLRYMLKGGDEDKFPTRVSAIYERESRLARKLMGGRDE